MKTSAMRRSSRRPAASLFEPSPDATKRDVVLERIGHFARSVARRHMGERGASVQPCDGTRMLVALRGYYSTWSLCAPFRVPVLDEELEAVAVAAYLQACGNRRERTAA